VTRPQLVFIDTETTGLDAVADRLIEVAAVRVNARLRITERFRSLVRPGIPVSLMVQRLTGITAAELGGAPPIDEVYPRFVEFVGDAVVVGQNVGFDLGFLTAAARRRGRRPPAWSSFDTLEASLLLYPELDRHGLDAMAQYLQVEPPAHRALRDAEATVELFAALCGRAAALADPERRLLQGIAWPPLALLDRFRQAPREAPPPLVAAAPSGPAAAGPAALDVQADG